MMAKTASNNIDHLHPDQAQDPLREPLVSYHQSTEDEEPGTPFSNNLSDDDAAANEEEEEEEDDDDEKNIIIRCGCCRPDDKKVILNMNHNVVLELILCATYGMSDSLWAGTVLAAYLKKLGQQQQQDDNDSPAWLSFLVITMLWSVRPNGRLGVRGRNREGGNAFVGNVEAASGLATLFSALPVGYLADTLPGGRSIVLKFGGILLVVTAIFNAVLFEWIGGTGSGDEDDSFVPPPNTEIYLALIMALWGVGGGIVSGPAEALFADSTPRGKRSQYYMYLFVCYEIASCLGPLVSIVLFQVLGDDWDLEDLRIVMYVGLAMEVLNGALMMFFDDSKALDEDEIIESEQSVNENLGTVDDLPITTPTSSSATTTTISEPSLSDEEHTPSSSNDIIVHHPTSNDTASTPIPPFQTQRAWMVPAIVFVHSLIFALGSGMTVKFFPLFFKDQVGMSPTQVQIVYLILPLVLAGCGGVGNFIAGKGGVGRVGTALLFKIMGVLGLYSMVVFKDYLNSHALLLVPIYIFRTALMNASYPLEESILMDFVPKNQRGRWKSLESIAAFGWCGSAALGGWTSDHAHGDYTYTFRITAAIQSLGILVWALLLPLVPRHEEGDSTEEERGNHDASLPEAVTSNDKTNRSEDDRKQSTLREPLLPDNLST